MRLRSQINKKERRWGRLLFSKPKLGPLDGLAMLIDRRPFNPGDSLRLRFRRSEFDYLAFKVERIAGSNGRQPPQVVHA